MKIFIGGIAVGLANIIPGVSGGTMMVVLGLFDDVMYAISALFKRNNINRKQDFLFLVKIAIGAVFGLVFFAKLLDLLFLNYPIQTMIGFVGMVSCSIPSLISKEMNNTKISITPFVIGILLILVLQLNAPISTDLVIEAFPVLSTSYLVTMLLSGCIAGGAMFIPGVSGSMLLLITGQYYLFKSLLSNVTTFSIDVLIPLSFIAVGIIFGIVLSSKITGYFLKNHHKSTMSFILGLVVSSCLVLFPFNANFDFITIITGFLSFLIGGLIVLLLEKIS